METPIRISVIIPTLNGLVHLRDCLPSVCRAVEKSPCAVEIIVADDNSTDATLDFLHNSYPQIKTVKNPRQGASSVRNAGVSQAIGNIFLFIDNDVFLEEDFFVKALPYLHTDMFAVASAGYNFHTGAQQDGLKLISFKRGFLRFTKNILNANLKPAESYASFGVQGAYFFCGKDKFTVLGGFDELYEPYALEETDLVYRGLKRGWEIAYANDLKPLHKYSSTINSKKSRRTKFLGRRNRIIFMWKNVSSKKFLLSSLIFALLTPLALLETLKRLKEIKRQREAEARSWTVSDEELLERCANYQRSIAREGGAAA
ncbi:MAG: glycosyltransferase [Desulfovibrionaceae bacterium]|nr:glycosyltransferase [Desulfovibrionaceae bacterium]